MNHDIPVHPNADLQRRILLAMKTKPAASIAELARRVDAVSPSASRALHALESRGLVERKSRQWVLTALGNTAAERVLDQVPARSEQAVATAGRVLARQRGMERVLGLERPTHPMLQQFVKEQAGMVSQMTETLGADLSKLSWISEQTGYLSRIQDQLDWVRTMNDLLGPHKPMLDAIAQRSSLIEQVGQLTVGLVDRLGLLAAVEAAMSAQRVQLSAFDAVPVMQFPELSRWLGESLAPAGRMVADLSSVSVAVRAFTPAGLPLIVQAAAEVVRTHHVHIRDALGHLGEVALHPSIDWTPSMVATEVFLPTYTTARFVGVARHVVEERDAESGRPLRLDLAEEREAALLDALGVLGPQFVAMWRGAWHALSTGGPDTIRQAAHSGRELLNQVLAVLAPDDLFAGEVKVTRAMRVKKIVGPTSESKRDWADSVARNVDETYALLSGEAHLRQETARFDEEGLAGVLETTAGLIRFLLSCSDGSSQR